MNAYELADLVDERYAWIETKELSNMLRQQADELTEAGGMIGVLREKVSQQADRITELEKQLQESAMNCISAYAQADDHYARLQELEAKVRGEK